MKHKLPYTRARLARARIGHPVKHTQVLPLPWAVAVALDLVYRGWPRVGAQLLLQWAFGLRPSEVLMCVVEDLIQPSSFSVPMVLLGRRTRGTKAGRAQFGVGNLTLTPWLAPLLRRFVRGTPARSHLSSVTNVSEYSRLIATSSRNVGMMQPASGHSARAGWATFCRQQGVPFAEIMEHGRWVDPASLRIYLDIQGAALLPAPDRISVMANWTLEDLESRFPWWS